MLELCDGADLLIHDAQYTPAEFAAQAHWGHCTVDYAVHVAAEAGESRLALFHHDPSHDDDTLDRITTTTGAVWSPTLGVDVFAAVERSSVTLGMSVVATIAAVVLGAVFVLAGAAKVARRGHG